MVRQIAVATQFAHAAGIIHRDLKPRNILLDESGRIRVTDFGLAKVVQSTGVQSQDEPMHQQITATGQVLGTLSYMSPEQAAGEEAGPATDIYSLGAVLYELLTGQPPFKANSVLDLLQQIQTWLPISPRECEALTRKALFYLEAESQNPNCPSKVLLYRSSCYNNLGVFALIRNDDTMAESNFKLALDARERLAAQLPADIETNLYLSRSLTNVAQIQLRRNSRDEADTTLTKAIDVMEKVVLQVPGNQSIRQEFANLLVRHGEMLMEHQPESAIARFDQALVILSVASLPGALAATAQRMAIGVQVRRATTLDRLQRTAEAEAAWEQVYQLAPPDMQAGVRLGRAFSLVRLGNFARAIEVTEQAAGQQNLPEDDMYNCACVMALASGAAASEPEAKDRSAARAVELLQRISDGYFNAERLEHMKHDADLDSLRERADYQEWLAKLEVGLNKSNLGDSVLDERDCPK